MTTQTLETVLRTVRHYKLLSSNQTLIVGVSGGTDSTALLHILFQLQAQLNIQLHVATLNHGIRGKSSELDVQFVRQMAEQLHIPYTQGYRNVPQFARGNGIGVEEAARIARYAFLADVAQQQNTKDVAVAHHADDQAETILMHIIRGSGLNGLRGMQVSSAMPAHPDLTLIRPLLNISRTELEQYCDENDLMPRHDETNDNIAYQRNYVRHKIIPRLANINPAVVSALLRLSDSVSVDEAFLIQAFNEDVMPHVVQEKERWSIPLGILAERHVALQRRFVLQAFQTLSPDDSQLSLTQIINVLERMGNAQVGTQLDLGQDIRCRFGYEQLFIENQLRPITDDDGLLPVDTNEEIPVLRNVVMPRTIVIHNLSMTFSDKRLSKDNLTVLELHDNAVLRLRTRHAGDRFQPKGMNGHSRKLKDWMIDKKIPRQIRDRIPLITVDGNIVAIYVEQTWHLAYVSADYLDDKNKIYLTLG